MKQWCNSSAYGEDSDQKGPRISDNAVVVAERSTWAVLALFALVFYGSWAVFHYQFENLPAPLTVAQVGKKGFSEDEALKHVEALTDLGPHPVGSDALGITLQYVLSVAESIQKNAEWEVDVEVDYFQAKSGANRLDSGSFRGKSLVYSNLNHTLIRVSPKYPTEAKYPTDARENAILVSSHVDTVFSAPGAGDDSSSVAVMLELARGISQSAQGFKHSVIFLFNTGEEDGLNGAHSFVTQHPWNDTVRVAVDLEAMGIGGKSAIFQAGPDPFAIENFAKAAKYPSGQIAAQDLFSSGVINSATDFQVYKEVAGLSGLDFAYSDNTAVYHTKNDKLKFLKPGSLQHLGENMLPFLLQAAASPGLPEAKTNEQDGISNEDSPIYFDILGTYMLVFRQRLASMVYTFTIMLSLLIWFTSLMMGGSPGIIALALSCLSITLMWICSITLAVLVAFLLPLVSSSPVPYVSSPWLVVGLFGGPAILGALIGQHLGYLILSMYLSTIYSKRYQNLSASVQADVAKLDSERWLFKGGLNLSKYLPTIYSKRYRNLSASVQADVAKLNSERWLFKGGLILSKYLSTLYSKRYRNLSASVQADVAQLDSERWLFKGGLIQWLLLLILGNYYEIGSIYLALVWLVFPAFAYGLLEATLSPARLPKALKTQTLLVGLPLPFLLTSGIAIRLTATLIGNIVRFDRNPGSSPEWMANVVVAIIVVAIVCLTLVYLLSYVHNSGALVPIIITALVLSVLSVGVISLGLVQPFTEDTARAVNVVHVVDTTGGYSGIEVQSSYISLFSSTPGNLNKEAALIGEGMVCGRERPTDFVTFSVEYGCWTDKVAGIGWDRSEVPSIRVANDAKDETRITDISLDAKLSIRWALAINMGEIEDFQLKDAEDSEVLIPLDSKSSVNGWHIIQFAGGQSSPTRFNLTLFWRNGNQDGRRDQPLLKLRTDVDRLTPAAQEVLMRLPAWCLQFGKSTNPHNLAFLSSLPVAF